MIQAHGFKFPGMNFYSVSMFEHQPDVLFLGLNQMSDLGGWRREVVMNKDECWLM